MGAHFQTHPKQGPSEQRSRGGTCPSRGGTSGSRWGHIARPPPPPLDIAGTRTKGSSGLGFERLKLSDPPLPPLPVAGQVNPPRATRETVSPCGSNYPHLDPLGSTFEGGVGAGAWAQQQANRGTESRGFVSLCFPPCLFEWGQWGQWGHRINRVLRLSPLFLGSGDSGDKNGVIHSRKCVIP